VNDNIDVGEVLDELDPLGKALFDAALARTRLKKALERLGEVEAENAHLKAEKEGNRRGD